MTQGQQNTNTDKTTQPPQLSIDWELYGQYLENSDLDDEQKKELIETLWSLVITFVDFGFDIETSIENDPETAPVRKYLDAQGNAAKRKFNKGASYVPR